MIVLYICCDANMGGSTASLLDLIESLKGELHPIVLFPKEGVGIKLFQEHNIESYVYPFTLLSALQKNRLLDVWKHPSRWHYIKKLRSDLGCLLYVKKILNGRKVDIIHTNTCPNDVGVLLSKALHAKHVWHVRECMDAHGNIPMYGGYEKLIQTIRRSDAVIPISNSVMEHYRFDPRNTYVINDGIRSREDIIFSPQKEKYVLFSAYCLTKAKGTLWAIEAFEKSGLYRDGFKLKIMGNIEPVFVNELMEAVSKSSCSQDIELVPCQADVKPFFTHASAYVMASDFEGLGRVTAEAMFYGCPVVARATGGTLDLVKDGETGYLFDTIDECAVRLRKVCLTDQTDIILRAQKFASDHLSHEVYGPKIMAIYRKVMN